MSWISVKDRLPATTCMQMGVLHRGKVWVDSEEVLVADSEKYVFTARFRGYEGEEYWSTSDGLEAEVTHWQPLPEPPEE